MTLTIQPEPELPPTLHKPGDRLYATVNNLLAWGRAGWAEAQRLDKDLTAATTGGARFAVPPHTVAILYDFATKQITCEIQQPTLGSREAYDSDTARSQNQDLIHHLTQVLRAIGAGGPCGFSDCVFCNAKALLQRIAERG